MSLGKYQPEPKEEMYPRTNTRYDGRESPEQIVPEKRWTTNDCISDLEKSLASLDDAIRVLEKTISPILENCDHISFPRQDRSNTSALNERINGLTYFVESLYEYVRNVQDRVRL